MREVSESVNRCEVTYIGREPIALDAAVAEHRQYQDALKDYGIQVVLLPSLKDFPDSVFVEDTAVIFNELALLTRPGALSRRAEVEHMAPTLSRYRSIARIEEPGTLDGGDVLVLDKEVYVGMSTRSNDGAVLQMRKILSPFGYEVVPIRVPECLHLKSAVTRASHDTLLINPQWIDRNIFSKWKVVEVDPTEPGAANIVAFEGGAIFPAQYPKTRERLEKAGICNVRLVDAGELAKAEGAVTCCSLLLKVFPKE